MAQVKDVSADMGAAKIGLSLTFTNLEEVQTQRRGKGKDQKKKNKITYTQKNPTICAAGAGSRIEEKEQKTMHSCSHHRAQLDFFY